MKACRKQLAEQHEVLKKFKVRILAVNNCEENGINDPVTASIIFLP